MYYKSENKLIIIYDEKWNRSSTFDNVSKNEFDNFFILF